MNTRRWELLKGHPRVCPMPLNGNIQGVTLSWYKITLLEASCLNEGCNSLNKSILVLLSLKKKKKKKKPYSKSWASQVALAVKNSPTSAGDIRDAGSIPRLGRSPGGGNSNPLQCSCLENPRDREAWWAIVHRVTESRTQLSTLACSALGDLSKVCLYEFFLVSLCLWVEETPSSVYREGSSHSSRGILGFENLS